jgi:hypothetical protein
VRKITLPDLLKALAIAASSPAQDLFDEMYALVGRTLHVPTPETAGPPGCDTVSDAEEEDANAVFC